MRSSRRIIFLTLAAGLLVVIAWQWTGQRDQTPNDNRNTVAVNTEVDDVPATLELSDFEFQPTEFTVPADQTVRVRLINRGQEVHDLTFTDLDFTSGPIEPGASRIVTFTVPAAAGQHEFYCGQGDHRDQGMVGVMKIE